MIFRQIDEIRSGRKTQTRRAKRPDDVGTVADIPDLPHHFKRDGVHIAIPQGRLHEVRILSVERNGRTLYEVGKTYAMVPKRGAKAVGRILITAIREERIADISEADAIAEGVENTDAYCALWQSINGKTRYRWENNPEVWVYDFVYVTPSAG